MQLDAHPAFQILSDFQKTALKKGNVKKITDLLLSSPQEIARKCKISPLEAKRILDTVCTHGIPYRVRRLDECIQEGDEQCSTGDPILDEALGGGIKTGMIWEIVGESAAGKTQMALQLSLFVQIPQELGGLSGTTCYLTTSSQLPTSRLLQISEAHPLLNPSICSLGGIHTISAPTIPRMIQVLSETLPHFIETSRGTNVKPVKLLVIDALAELFHTSDKTTTSTLVQRSQNIAEISALLHVLATTHRLAIVVLNEVADVFDRRGGESDSSDLVYTDQSRWFSQADSIPGENRKKATLGLVWANQVNARILLTRTGRRRYLGELESPFSKRRRTEEPIRNTVPSETDNQSTLIRRLSVIFSSVSFPISLDYMVSEEGISIIPDSNTLSTADQQQTLQLTEPTKAIADSSNLVVPKLSLQLSPLDVGFAEDPRNSQDVVENTIDEPEDEWEQYWATDGIPDEAFNDLDFEALG